MNSFFKTLGISILILISTSFIGILLIGDVLYLSIFSMLITYLLNGYLAARLTEKFPYYHAYMTAMVLLFINFLFSKFVIGLNVFVNPDIIFYSLLTGTLLSVLGGYIHISLHKSRVEHA